MHAGRSMGGGPTGLLLLPYQRHERHCVTRCVHVVKYAEWTHNVCPKMRDDTSSKPFSEAPMVPSVGFWLRVLLGPWFWVLVETEEQTKQTLEGLK